MKKGDVNWTLVMMILALVVLVVLIFIFKDISFGARDNLNQFNTCEGKGGTPTLKTKGCTEGYMQIPVASYADKELKKNDYVCCIDKDKFLGEK